MQKSNLQFENEEDLQKFLKEAQEKSDEGDYRKQYSPPGKPGTPYNYATESKKAGGMNNKYHYYRMIVFMVSGIFLIAIGDKIVTAIGVGLVALSIILHQATMSIVIREGMK